MPPMNKIHDLVEQDRFELMMLCPFYGRIICSAEFVFVRDPQVRLACTDYRRIFISADTYPNLSEENRLAVLAHEVLHIALRHAFRIGYRDKNRFEKAADIEVTFVLTESFPDPYGIKFKEEWRDLTAEQIYELLPPREDKTKAKSEHCSPEDDKQDGSGSEDKPVSDDGAEKTDDRTEEMDDKNDKSKEDKKTTDDSQSKDEDRSTRSASDDVADSDNGKSSDNNNDSGNGEGSDDGNGSSNGNGSGDGNGNGSGNGNGNGSGGGSQDIISEFRPQFDAETEMNCVSLSSGTLMDMRRFGAGFGKGIGSSSGSFERLLEALSTPHVSWLVLLRQFLRLCRGGGYSWMRPNRRLIAHGVYLPGRQCKSFTGIVALDTSPSTFADLPRFVAELMGLLKSFGKYDITVLECAKSIEQVWNISSNEPILNVSEHAFKMGFGTDFTPVFDYICDHHLAPNILIYFTDGDGPCPEAKPPYPVLWVLPKGGEAPVPWGQVIYYEEN